VLLPIVEDTTQYHSRNLVSPPTLDLWEGTLMSRFVGIMGLLLAGALTIGPHVFGQQLKPRVYINGTGNVDVRTDGSAVGGNSWLVGSSHSTVSAHNQTMELAKDFSKQCPDVIVTLNATDADYTVDLNHEAFQGLIHKNNKAMVTNRRGDLLMSDTTRTVSHSTNNSCSAILADWKTNGRIEAPVPVTPASEAASQKQTAVAPVPTSTPAPTVQPAVQGVTLDQTESLGDIARRVKAQKAQQQQSTGQPSPAPQN
jgi:hypothetical protein